MLAQRDAARFDQAVAVVGEEGDAQAAPGIEVEFAQQGIDLNQQAAHLFARQDVVERVGGSDVGQVDFFLRGQEAFAQAAQVGAVALARQDVGHALEDAAHVVVEQVKVGNVLLAEGEQHPARQFVLCAVEVAVLVARHRAALEHFRQRNLALRREGRDQRHRTEELAQVALLPQRKHFLVGDAVEAHHQPAGLRVVVRRGEETGGFIVFGQDGVNGAVAVAVGGDGAVAVGPAQVGPTAVAAGVGGRDRH